MTEVTRMKEIDRSLDAALREMTQGWPVGCSPADAAEHRRHQALMRRAQLRVICGGKAAAGKESENHDRAV